MPEAPPQRATKLRIAEDQAMRLKRETAARGPTPEQRAELAERRIRLALKVLYQQPRCGEYKRLLSSARFLLTCDPERLPPCSTDPRFSLSR